MILTIRKYKLTSKTLEFDSGYRLTDKRVFSCKRIFSSNIRTIVSKADVYNIHCINVRF